MQRSVHANIPQPLNDLARAQVSLQRLAAVHLYCVGIAQAAAEAEQNKDHEEAARLGSKRAAISEGTADDDNPHVSQTF